MTARGGAGGIGKHRKPAENAETSRNRKMASKSNPITFLQQVRQEVAKVTWPSRRETMITTVMVFIMVILAAFFFLAVDQVLSYVVSWLLQLGS